VNKKQRRTLEAIFAKPTPANIAWADIESLFVALGAEISERRGFRVAVELHGVTAIFHRPHPQKEARRYLVRDIRDFLINCEVIP
jgi:hypothetical protein